ncbi:MAG: hypothetical protein HC853_00050 [Anaerolineae bacterium]|nr:hypothetical protein [Anaerolineae bacterium]
MVAVSGDLDVALTQGPEAARWFYVASDPADTQGLQTHACNPFVPGEWLAGQLAEDRHHVRTVKNVLASGRTKASAKDVGVADYTWLETSPPECEGIRAWERLGPEARRVLAFLCHHSVCPVSILPALIALPAPEVLDVLDELGRGGLIEFVTRPDRAADPQRYASATEIGARLHFQAKGAPSVERLVKRYRAGHTDHARRLAHTHGIYDFFASLNQHAAGWDRVSQKLDVQTGDYNAGEVNACELEEFEEDIACSAVFLVRGVKHHWMPDAFGLLRQGHKRHRFWLEVDGSSAGRAHAATEVWESKLGALFAYYSTDKWRLRHRDFPNLLIVTTDLRILPVVQDVYVHARAAHQVPLLPVYLTSALGVAERGHWPRFGSKSMTRPYPGSIMPFVLSSAISSPNLKTQAATCHT